MPDVQVSERDREAAARCCQARDREEVAEAIAQARADERERLPSGKSLHDWMRNRGWVVTMTEAEELADAIKSLVAK